MEGVFVTPEESAERNLMVGDVDSMDMTGSVSVLGEEIVNEPVFKRPRRAAAIEATQTIKRVLKWEKCSESSSMFRNAANEINKEFDRVNDLGSANKKQSSNFHSPYSDSVGFLVDSSTSATTTTNLPMVDTILSDDECDALKSDEEDNDDDAIDSDDETSSLKSFVVDDDHVSDDEACDNSETETKQESQSESESDEDDTCSDEGDESVECDDDSDADASVESKSEIGSNVTDDEASDATDEMEPGDNDTTQNDGNKTTSTEVGVNDIEIDKSMGDVIDVDKKNNVNVDVHPSCSVSEVGPVDVSVEEFESTSMDVFYENVNHVHESVDASHDGVFSGLGYEVGSSPTNIDSFFSGG